MERPLVDARRSTRTQRSLQELLLRGLAPGPWTLPVETEEALLLLPACPLARLLTSLLMPLPLRVGLCVRNARAYAGVRVCIHACA